MTEYDFSPEGFERYRSTQDRIAQWAGSSQQYPSVDPYMMSTSEDGRGYLADGNGDWATNDHHSGHRRQAYYGHRNGIFQPGHDRNVSDWGMSPNFNQRGTFPSANGVPFDPQMIGFNNGQPNTGNLPLGSRNGFENPAGMELPPLQQHYAPPRPQGSMHDMHRITANHELPDHLSQRHPSHPILMPGSATGPHFRSASEEWTSSRSYSSDSYSTSSSRSFTSRPYQTVHPSTYTPTIIQPSRHHPIVVPVNGGHGGYVVVPAVGQDLRVVDPSGRYHKSNRSLIGRLLSPSKWAVRSKSKSKRRVIQL